MQVMDIPGVGYGHSRFDLQLDAMVRVVELSALEVVVPVDDRVDVVGGERVGGAVVELLVGVWLLFVAGQPADKHGGAIGNLNRESVLDDTSHLVDVLVNQLKDPRIYPLDDWPATYAVAPVRVVVDAFAGFVVLGFFGVLPFLDMGEKGLHVFEVERLNKIFDDVNVVDRVAEITGLRQGRLHINTLSGRQKGINVLANLFQ